MSDRDQIGITTTFIGIGSAPVADEDLARISPLMHRHVIPNGTYHFSPAIEGDHLS